MSAQIAISPAGSGFAESAPTAGGSAEGKESTSVDLLCPRKLRFSDRIALPSLTSTFTLPRKPAARRARTTNRASEFSLRPGTFFCRITNYVVAPSPLKLLTGKSGSSLIGRGLVIFFDGDGRCVGISRLGQQEHLLLGSRFMLVVGANNALHQVVAHHVGFVEAHKGESVHALQNIHGFNQAAAPR